MAKHAKLTGKEQDRWTRKEVFVALRKHINLKRRGSFHWRDSHGQKRERERERECKAVGCSDKHD